MEKKEDQNKLETLNVEVKSVIIKSVFEERRWTSIKSDETTKAKRKWLLFNASKNGWINDEGKEEMDSIFDEIQV